MEPSDPRAATSELSGDGSSYEVELDEFLERAGAEPEATDGADRLPVRGDRRDRRGQTGAVRQACLDAGRDPVEPIALDLLEQALEEGATGSRPITR